MKTNGRTNIRRLINLEETDGLRESIERLKKRFEYLKSKNYIKHESNQMKYIKFHLRKLGALT